MTPSQRPIGSGFDAESTATDVLAGVDLSGHTAVVTGGASGLGLETTRALAGAGATVIVPARDAHAAVEATRGIPAVEADRLDLADLGSVERFASGVLRSGRRVDLLVANAGIMACPETRVGPGWEAQLAINHIGHHALINHLAPVLGGARVVLVSSAGQFLSGIRWHDLHFDRGYDRWEAYAQSKTAVALTAVHLAEIGRSRDVSAFAVHPGSILTPLQRHVPLAEQLELGWVDSEGRRAEGFKTPEQGAATAVWAATAPGLERLAGAYCQDCDVASPAVDDDMLTGGVKPWAVDPDDAARLWARTSALTGTDGFSEDR